MGVDNLLVAVRDEKVRLQIAHIEMDVPNTVRTIDHTQDPLFPADGSEPLEGEAHTRIANDGIEDSRANREPFSTSLLDNITEPLFKVTLRNGILKGHFPSLQGRMFLQRDQAFLHGAVDWLEIDDYLPGLEVQVVQDGCDAGSSVFDKDTFVLFRVENFCELAPCFV